MTDDTIDISWLIKNDENNSHVCVDVGMRVGVAFVDERCFERMFVRWERVWLLCTRQVSAKNILKYEKCLWTRGNSEVDNQKIQILLEALAILLQTL
jgi:hypothetical protein